MFRKRNWFYAVLISAAVMVVLYGVPTVVEWRMATRWGILPAVLFGNLLGCSIIATFDPKRGIALYATLNICEWLLVESAILSPRGVILIADLVPTGIIGVFVFLISGYALDFMDGVEPRRTRPAFPSLQRAQ